MPLTLTPEQALLRSTAEAFFASKAPVSALRRLRDTDSAAGYSPDLWRAIAAMGWPGSCIPEHYGGAGCGFMELGIVLQASGRTLVASPLLSTSVLAVSGLLLGGQRAQQAAYLPQIADGNLLVSLAHEEGPHHQPHAVTTTATPHGAGFLLNGCKVSVLDGHIANQLIVVARTAGDAHAHHGISLFLVDAARVGISITRRAMVDSRNMAEVRLQSVAVSQADLLGELHEGASLLVQILDRGVIALASEMLGALQAAFERTLDYLKQREQFGAVIGSFQALQHRAAKMFCEIELAKSTVMRALQAIDENAEDLSLLASLAKVQVGETYRLVSDEAIQIFGGIGMTDEEDIGFYLKRARVAQQTMGDESYHLQRYASLRGY